MVHDEPCYGDGVLGDDVSHEDTSHRLHAVYRRSRRSALFRLDRQHRQAAARRTMRTASFASPEEQPLDRPEQTTLCRLGTTRTNDRCRSCRDAGKLSCVGSSTCQIALLCKKSPTKFGNVGFILYICTLNVCGTFFVPLKKEYYETSDRNIDAACVADSAGCVWSGACGVTRARIRSCAGHVRYAGIR